MKDFIEFVYTDAVGKRRQIEINPHSIDTYEGIEDLPEGSTISYPQTIIGLRDGREFRVHENLFEVKRRVEESESYSRAPSPIENDVNSIKTYLDYEFKNAMTSIVNSLNSNATANDVTSLKGLIYHILKVGIEDNPQQMTEILHDLYPNANNIELLGALNRIKVKMKPKEVPF